MSVGPPAVDRAAGQTFVSKLSLVDFRNYTSLSIGLRPGPIVLTGENGAGKTNLLEAVSFLSPGRGLRRAAYAEVAREGVGSGFAVSCEVEGRDVAWAIGTGTAGADPGGGETGR